MDLTGEGSPRTIAVLVATMASTCVNTSEIVQ
jgi:hypothetical protein